MLLSSRLQQASRYVCSLVYPLSRQNPPGNMAGLCRIYHAILQILYSMIALSGPSPPGSGFGMKPRRRAELAAFPSLVGIEALEVKRDTVQHALLMLLFRGPLWKPSVYDKNGF